jgi:hypothetical protein
MCVGGSFKVLPGFVQDSSRVLPRLFLPRVQDSSRVLPRLFLPRYLLKAICTRLKSYLPW